MFDTGKFGRYVQKKRKALDLTQSELADRLESTRSVVANIESGDSVPEISTFPKIAQALACSVEELILSGAPTADEAKILSDIIKGGECDLSASINTVIGVAPLVKPSVLDKLASNLAKQDIDISHIVDLAEYLSDDSVKGMIENMDGEDINPELLEKLVPLLDDKSILAIFGKILDGEMPWEYIKIIVPYGEFISEMVEAAVVEGALPWEVMEMLYPDGWKGKPNRDGRWLGKVLD